MRVVKIIMDFALRMVKVLNETIQKRLDISSCRRIKVIPMLNIVMVFAFIMAKVLNETIQKRLDISRCQQMKVTASANDVSGRIREEACANGHCC